MFHFCCIFVTQRRKTSNVSKPQLICCYQKAVWLFIFTIPNNISLWNSICFISRDLREYVLYIKVFLQTGNADHTSTQINIIPFMLYHHPTVPLLPCFSCSPVRKEFTAIGMGKYVKFHCFLLFNSVVLNIPRLKQTL